jgi:Leucine-rich repeat (LRR) protein
MLSLRDLFLGTNKFTGTIPEEIGELTELRAFGLDENFLTGKIPNIWTCSKLLILYLDSNQLTGTISPEIKGMTELIDVRFRKNVLTGTIPPEIHDLTHLELFYVDDNKLTGTIPATWELMTRLQELQFYKNDLTGVLPDSMHTLKDLSKFVLSIYHNDVYAFPLSCEMQMNELGIVMRKSPVLTFSCSFSIFHYYLSQRSCMPTTTS